MIFNYDNNPINEDFVQDFGRQFLKVLGELLHSKLLRGNQKQPKALKANIHYYKVFQLNCSYSLLYVVVALYELTPFSDVINPNKWDQSSVHS